MVFYQYFLVLENCKFWFFKVLEKFKNFLLKVCYAMNPVPPWQNKVFI